MIKKLFYFIATTFLIISISSCASTNVNDNTDAYIKKDVKEAKASNNNPDAAQIKKYKDSMFWEINGKDNNGVTSTVYILGTIHVGDDRLYPVPDFIEAAYDNSDRIIGELSTDAWEAMSVATNKKKNDSEKREAERIKETGKTISDYLTDDEKNFLLKYVKNEDLINRFEPWFLYSELSEIPVSLSGLDSTKSYDMYFIEKSLKNERYIEGLDTLETQLDTISYGDWNTQLAMLKDTINDLLTDSELAGQHILDVYETYIAADEKKLSKIINSNMKNNNAEYAADYYNTLFIEKNKDWAGKIENFIKDGGTTFIFASCGHFVGEDSVFNFMADNQTLNY